MLAVFAPAFSADWREVALDDAGNRYLVDWHRIERGSGRVSATVRTEFARPRIDARYVSGIFAMVDRIVADCQTMSLEIESRTLVFADGREQTVLAPDTQRGVYYPAPPGSMSEKVIVELCRSGPAPR